MTTLNPADLFDITLSNGNLTATSKTSATTDNQVRSTTSRAGGKYHIELTTGSTYETTNSGNCGFGIASASHTLGGLSYVGKDTTSVGWYDDGGIYFNGSAVLAPNTVTHFTASQVLCIEWDIGNALIWVKNVTTAGNWNNNGTANPATGTGGISTASLTGSPWFAIINMLGSTSYFCTINLGASAFSLAPSTGFVAWDIVLPAVAGSYAITGSAAELVLTEPWAAGSYTITGSAATLLEKHLLPGAIGSYAITGTPATLALTLPLAAGSYAITGSAAKLVLTEPWAAGSYTISGSAAGLIEKHVLTGVAGAYTISGSPANFAVPEAWNIGAYNISGQAASLLAGHLLPAAAGAYTVTGSPAQFSLTEPWAAGAYAIAGAPATLLTTGNFVLPAVAGSYALTGSAATLLEDHILGGATGSYTVNGQPANFAVPESWNIGGYSLTGSPAGLLQGHVLPGAGAYSISGTSAALFWKHELLGVAGAYSLTGDPANLIVTVPFTQTGTLYVTECNKIIVDTSHHWFEAPATPSIADQSIPIGNASMAGNPFNVLTRYVLVNATSTCSLAFGLAPVAVPTAHRMSANETRVYGVQPGQTVAVIENV